MNPPPSFSLRDGVLADVPDIARLVRGLAEYEKLAHEAVATEADFARVIFGPEPRAHSLVAEVDGKSVGLLLWFYNFSTFTGRQGMYVEDVFVEPEYRSLGIGRAFFVEMARRALREGCGRLEWSVLDWNLPALRLYRAMGAVAMDGWTVQRLSGEALAALAQEG